LPGYESSYDELCAQGIDEIYCVSVNDAFVLRQWGLHQGLEEDKEPGSLGFKKVKLIPDGNCQFTRKMGMSCTWSEERGFGERSWRYSAVLDNMKIEKMFIEGGQVSQDSEEDPLEVSDHNTMLLYLMEKNKKDLKEQMGNEMRDRTQEEIRMLQKLHVGPKEPQQQQQQQQQQKSNQPPQPPQQQQQQQQQSYMSSNPGNAKQMIYPNDVNIGFDGGKQISNTNDANNSPNGNLQMPNTNDTNNPPDGNFDDLFEF
jgi:peroxiredoxin